MARGWVGRGGLAALLLLAGCGPEARQPLGKVDFSVDPPPGLAGDVRNEINNNGVDRGFEDNPIPRRGQIYPGTDNPISRPLQ